MIRLKTYDSSWIDKEGRWQISRRQYRPDQFTAQDLYGSWELTLDTLADAVEAIAKRSKNQVQVVR